VARPRAGRGRGAAELAVSNAVSALRLPVATEHDPAAAEGFAYAPAAFAGALSLSGQRPVRFEAASGELAMSRRGYASFRMYARTIDDVEPLRYGLEAEGIPVYTAAEQIRQVKEMDRYLTLIFWLVAVVGIAGSVASLVASLYASVERKRRELGVLRLIGFSGAALHLFPVFQGRASRQAAT